MASAKSDTARCRRSAEMGASSRVPADCRTTDRNSPFSILDDNAMPIPLEAAKWAREPSHPETFEAG